MYNFHAQLVLGQQAEQALDQFFADKFLIVEATLGEQRQGIDRFFKDRANGRISKIEYKSDWTASKTGNAFVETISVDRTGKQGWAYTSQADLLIYYLPDDLLVYVISLVKLRECLPTWKHKYPQRKVFNGTYSTWGILVPLYEFEQIADTVISI